MKVENIVAQNPKRVESYKTADGQVVVKVNGNIFKTDIEHVNELETALIKAGYKIILSQTLRGIWRATRPPAPWFTIEAVGYTASASIGTDKIQYRDN